MKNGRLGNLTSFEAEHAKPGETRREISDGRGLWLIVQPAPSGRKSWAYRYRDKNGRAVKLTLGPFPEVSLAQARDKLDEARRTLKNGADPAAVKREQRERRAYTVRTLAAEYVEKWQKPRNRTWLNVEQCLARIMLPRLGNRDVREVTRRDVAQILEGRNRGTYAIVRAFWKWCLDRDYIDVSPAAPVKAQDPIAVRDRELPAGEVLALLQASKAMGRPWSAVYELLLLTAQRRSEVAEADWSEFDLEGALWTIPAERSKNGLAHLVPLAPRVLEILRKLPSKDEGGLLFPADRGGEGAVSGFSRAKVRLDALMQAELQKAAKARGEDPERVEPAPWVVHDLRRTAASNMARLGHGIHVVERVLNHTRGATTGGLIGVYQKHDFLAERRAALEDWARQVQAWRSPPRRKR